MRELLRLAELNHAPLLAEPWAAACVFGVLGDRLGWDAVEIEVDGRTEIMPAATLADVAQLRVQQSREYAVEDGVAVIPVLGSLADRSFGLQPTSGLTGYNAIARQINVAMADAEVGALALDIHSPGGVKTGNFELAAHIRAASAIKPIWAIVADQAFSAAYSIASAASRVIAPATGMVGSIGVITAHVDLSARMAREGRRVTIIKAGAHKADGNPFEALPDEVLARIQAKIDRIYEEFVDLVAHHRGISAAAVKATEAETLFGADALPIGLIDAVMSPADALSELKQLATRGRFGRSSGSMVAMTTNPGAVSTTAGEMQIGALDMSHLTGPARLEGIAEGRRLERERIGAILGSPEAAGREAAARQLALHTEMEAAAISALLGTLPKAVEVPIKAASTDFAAAMTGLGNPQVGADDGGSGSDDQIDLLAKHIASFARA